MGIFDAAKDKLAENSEAVESAVEKVGDTIDEKTGGKYSEQVDKAQSAISEQLKKL